MVTVKRASCGICGKIIRAGSQHHYLTGLHKKCYLDEDARIRAVREIEHPYTMQTDPADSRPGHWNVGDIRVISVTDPENQIPADRRYSAGMQDRETFIVKDNWGKEPPEVCDHWPDCTAKAAVKNGKTPQQIDASLIGMFRWSND